MEGTGAHNVHTESRLRALEDWRLTVETRDRLIGRLIVGIFGTSLLTTIVSITTIIVLLTEHH